MTEITFLVHEAEEGGFYAEALGFGIFAEGDTVDELKASIKGGISLYFEGADISFFPVATNLIKLEC